MADLKISQLPAATTPLAGTEVLPIVQGGSTVKVAVNDLTAGKAVSATSVTATTVTATTVQGSLDTNVAAAKLTVSGTSAVASGTDTNINITLTPKGTGVVTTAASYNDASGKLRAIPAAGAAKTASYTLAITDVGEFVELGTSGTIVIPASVFAAGDAISIFNNTSGTIACTCSAITTVYKGGFNTNISATGFSITTRGVCTILFVTATTVVITGNLA
jgi:hypothetical protein